MDIKYMEHAIQLAKKGIGKVNPNPLVGAVLVKDDRIIGEGCHARYGELHAERNALANCREDPRGAELYVTLEPCCHYGKQPPCTEAIIEAGIKRVYVGSPDPNPLVAGKGIQILREHGIEVAEYVDGENCDALNPVFFHYIRTKTPYVVMKYAMTFDGKIATASGQSKWITGEAARAMVQETRNALTGIMVGVGTVLEDDPLLTCRIEGGRNPVRIICDTRLRTPMNAQVVTTANEVKTILAAGEDTIQEQTQKVEAYRQAGCEVLGVSKAGEHLDLKELMQMLGEKGIDGILLEGGSTLNASALEQGIVQEVHTYMAPKLFGGAGAKSPIGGIGVETPQDAWKLKTKEIRQIGDDFWIRSEVAACLPES